MTAPDASAAEQTALDAPPQQMTTRDLLKALRVHYTGRGKISDRTQVGDTDPELLVEEVAAPFSNRRCDLLRLGIWPSRGHHIVVHELKVSREDWRRELDDPTKAEAWWPYCHQFWIVAPAGVVDPAEVPDQWGLMIPPANQRHRRFRIVKPASVKNPDLTVELLVEIVRRVDNARLTQIIQLNQERDELIRRQVCEQVAEEMKAHTRQALAARVPPDVADRLELLEKLETALGVDLSLWGGLGVDEPLKTMRPDEIAAALTEYTFDHVALQRRAADLQRAAAKAHRAATNLTADLSDLLPAGERATTGGRDA